MNYPDYLVHFNKNHLSKNGQFVSGYKSKIKR